MLVKNLFFLKAFRENSIKFVHLSVHYRLSILPELLCHAYLYFNNNTFQNTNQIWQWHQDFASLAEFIHACIRTMKKCECSVSSQNSGILHWISHTLDLGTVYVFVSGNMRIMSINRNNLPREQNPDVHGKKTVRQSLTGLRIWPEHTAPQPNEDSP